MKNILIYQHQSSMNHGCEALVYTISKQIKNLAFDSDITVASFFKKDDECFEFPNVDQFVQNTQWLRRLTFPWLVYQIDKRFVNSTSVQERFMYCKPCYELAKKADVCVAIGGDTYCYNKGKEHWPLERKIKKLGKKMMLWGCSIEPMDIQGEMEEHLSNFDVITVRDSISYQALLDSRVKSKIYLCADPAFLLECENCSLPEGWDDGKMIGLNFSPMVMGQIKDKEKIRKRVCQLVEYILENSEDKVVLIPHVRLSFNNDMDELEPIYEKYKKTNRVLIVNDEKLSARNLKYIISKCKIFVGTRTHATIAAYSTGVPTLAIGYSVKARGIARDLFGNEKGMVVSIKNVSDKYSLINAYQNIYDKQDELREIIRGVMPKYKEKALISGKALQELVEDEE